MRAGTRVSRHGRGALTRESSRIRSRESSDLSPIDAQTSPEEVRPLVVSLNRLFELVQAQVGTATALVAVYRSLGGGWTSAS